MKLLQQTLFAGFIAICIFSVTQAQTTFPDVEENHKNYDAIEYVALEGIVNGYDDGTYRPEQLINRAEFTKIIIESTNPQAEIGANCFPDVEDQWFAGYVCGARALDIINGYPDGTFRPAQNIAFVEAAKIVSIAFGYEPIETSPWYKGYVENLGDENAIPLSIDSFEETITRGQLAEIIYRIKANPEKDSETYESLQNESESEQEATSNTDTESSEAEVSEAEHSEVKDEADANEAKNENDVSSEAEVSNTEHSEVKDEQNPPVVENSESGNSTIPNVDMAQVRTAWMKLFNDERATLGRATLSYDQRLDATALEWSKFMADKKEITHKRPGQTAYYDYNIIKNWFSDRGLEFANINRVTFSENIGMGVYKCNDSDCTQEMIEAIGSTFDFYMSEKTKASQPHYGSMTNEYFTVIGLGIYVDGDRYYLTVHYGTEIL